LRRRPAIVCPPFTRTALSQRRAGGAELLDLYRRAASYVDRVPKGEKPRALPIQQATKFGAVIKLKTAKALGLNVPISLLARTDEVRRKIIRV
jgi:ABC-type uncharacterized transport system substrate-binding protein